MKIISVASKTLNQNVPKNHRKNLVLTEVTSPSRLRSLFQMTADDVVFLASPLTFDPSVVDIFLALSSGAQLLILPSVVKKTPVRLAQLLFGDHKTTVLQASVEVIMGFVCSPRLFRAL